MLDIVSLWFPSFPSFPIFQVALWLFFQKTDPSTKIKGSSNSFHYHNHHLREHMAFNQLKLKANYDHIRSLIFWIACSLFYNFSSLHQKILILSKTTQLKPFDKFIFYFLLSLFLLQLVKWTLALQHKGKITNRDLIKKNHIVSNVIHV